jgi:Ca-activated chloride channel homolog
MLIRYPLFFLFIPFLIIIIFFSFKNKPSFFVPELSSKNKSRRYLFFLPEIFFIIAIIFFIIAFAEPYTINEEKTVDVYGTSIVFALDMSNSMLAEDYEPKNRFYVAVNSMKNFITKRKNDLLGLVVFGTNAYLVSPLTFNHDFLLKQIDALEINQIDGRTAIGEGLVTALKYLNDTQTESKVIILLTDGENNAGETDPKTATLLANALDIKIYTIGMGKEGGSPMVYTHPVHGRQVARDQLGNIVMLNIDEDMLKEIASITKAQYFRADNENVLEAIYKYIDELEQTKISTKTIETETKHHNQFILFAVVSLFLFFISKNIILRTEL